MSRHVYFSSFICSISLILFENLKRNNSVTEMTNKKTKQLSTSNKEIKHNKQVKCQVCQPNNQPKTRYHLHTDLDLPGVVLLVKLWIVVTALLHN